MRTALSFYVWLWVQKNIFWFHIEFYGQINLMKSNTEVRKRQRICSFKDSLEDKNSKCLVLEIAHCLQTWWCNPVGAINSFIAELHTYLSCPIPSHAESTAATKWQWHCFCISLRCEHTLEQITADVCPFRA